MGNITSFCCKDNISELDNREERSRILNDTDDIYSNSMIPGNGGIGGLMSQHDTISYGSMISNGNNGNKSMEQSALDKIYQKMASNVIDVAPGESMVIQQAEFIERKKVYQAKLNQIKTPLPLKLTNRMPKQVINATIINNSSNNNNINNHQTLDGISSLNRAGNSQSQMVNNNSSSNGNGVFGLQQNNNVTKAQEKRRVEFEPLSNDEIQLINEISLKSVQAIKNLRINSNEQVVAQFKP